MNRTRIVIAFCATITAMAVLTTVSSGSATSSKLYAKMDGKQEKPSAGDPTAAASPR